MRSCLAGLAVLRTHKVTKNLQSRSCCTLRFVCTITHVHLTAFGSLVYISKVTAADAESLAVIIGRYQLHVCRKPSLHQHRANIQGCNAEDCRCLLSADCIRLACGLYTTFPVQVMLKVMPIVDVIVAVLSDSMRV